jgi:hypothetical protein
VPHSRFRGGVSGGLLAAVFLPLGYPMTQVSENKEPENHFKVNTFDEIEFKTH